MSPVPGRCCICKLSGVKYSMNCAGVSLFLRPGWGDQQGRGAKARRSEPGWWGGRVVGREGCPFTSALPFLLQNYLPCDPASLLPTRQPCPGPLPRTRSPETGFIWGRLRGLMEQGGRLYPSPPRRVVLWGHCRGHSGQCAMVLSAQEPRDGLLTDEKGT